MRSDPAVALALLVASLLAPAAGATTVFSGTGAALLGDPDASFPTQAAAANGDVLEIAAPVANEVLVAYPLAAAGTFAGSAPVRITISLLLTRLSEDFDPVFAVSDGTNVVGGQVGDNPDGSARAIVGTLAADTLGVLDDPFIFQDAGFPAIASSLEATIEILLLPGSSDVAVAFLAGAGQTPTSAVLDRSADLAFLLVANSFPVDEVYGVSTLTLEIVQVPEPATAALLAFALAALARMRRR